MPSQLRWAALAAIWLAASAPVLSAQWQSNTGPRGAQIGATVGGEVERYLRALILAGVVAPLPWGARPFGAADLQSAIGNTADDRHPWGARYRTATRSRASVGFLGLASANSGFAWGANDGALWQGRGLTVASGLSATLRWGPLSAVAAPIGFVAQNADVPRLLPAPTGVSGDPLFFNNVDLPLQMGGSSYARLDPGESTIRLDAKDLTIGFSTASLGWGAAEAFPAILGANAGGFSHLFVGTSGRGFRIPRLGRLSARYVLGTLEQSRWSPVQGSETYVDSEQPGTRRVATGLVMSFMPALLPNFEIGANRFYHSPYLAGANRWSAWSRPFDVLFKKAARRSERRS
jgi:hypothetical protein